MSSAEPLGSRRLAPLSVGQTAELLRVTLEVRDSLWVACTGNSMWPTVRHGDEVLLASLSGPPRPGDVIAVETGRSLVLHRVKRLHGDRLTLIGDACRDEDPAATLGQVVAVARAVRGSRMAALQPTLHFGVLPLARWMADRARLSAARAWRAARRLAQRPPTR